MSVLAIAEDLQNIWYVNRISDLEQASKAQNNQAPLKSDVFMSVVFIAPYYKRGNDFEAKCISQIQKI